MAKPCPADIYLLKVNNRNIRNVSTGVYDHEHVIVGWVDSVSVIV